MGQTAYWKCEKREEYNGRLILTDGHVKKENLTIMHLIHQQQKYRDQCLP